MPGLVRMVRSNCDRPRRLERGQPEGVEPAYEPPLVEIVLTADELEREALYAGTVGYATK